MSIYQTPLQFGYFLALLFTVLLFFRGYVQERLSDKLLSLIMFLLAMQIQDYTFGFSGINILWEKFDGFPRNFQLLFGPAIYFYLLSQINRDFAFNRKQLLHIIPYAVYFIIKILLFAQGPEAVKGFSKLPIAQYLDILEMLAKWVSYVYYFILSLKILKNYGAWTATQFSEIDSISFNWLRNFIYLIIAGEIFKFGWNVADLILDLPFEQDFWWHLLTVFIICYVGFNGYSQSQPQKLLFKEKSEEPETNSNEKPEATINTDYAVWKPKIEKLMEEDKAYLEPELSLTEMAQKLRTNSSVLSAAINQNFAVNFNDFVNKHRIEEFNYQLGQPENKNYTKLAIALDCGFNSKATFNRALKKFG
jgi:AraC-like DNA-binding protein